MDSKAASLGRSVPEDNNMSRVFTISAIGAGQVQDKVTVDEGEVGDAILGMVSRGHGTFEVVEGDDGMGLDEAAPSSEDA